MSTLEAAFARWSADLEARHLLELRFPEVRRGLQALSSLYVERRERLAARGDAALDGAGKRAAFALYYAPLHFRVVEEVTRRLWGAEPWPASGPGADEACRILDLGCGTGPAGAALALALGGAARVEGVDRSGWAVAEAKLAYRALQVSGRARVQDVLKAPLPAAPPGAVVAAYTLNELDPGTREALLLRLLEAAARGLRVLVVEPIATRVSPWWDAAAARIEASGGRADEWRLKPKLPELSLRLAAAAGLHYRGVKARSLSHPGSRASSA